MKTPEDILSTCTVGGYANHGEYLYDAGEIKDAMKEYAKQWVHRCFADSVKGNPPAETSFHIFNEIDAQ